MWVGRMTPNRTGRVSTSHSYPHGIWDSGPMTFKRSGGYIVSCTKHTTNATITTSGLSRVKETETCVYIHGLEIRQATALSSIGGGDVESTNGLSHQIQYNLGQIQHTAQSGSSEVRFDQGDVTHCPPPHPSAGDIRTP